MSDAACIRSWLFVPGDDAKKHAKASASGADALIFDLEDSVSPQLLPKARALVCDFLTSHRERAAQQLWVRVNGSTSGRLADDLAAVMAGQPDGIVLPKVSGAREALAVAHLLAPLERQFGAAPESTQLLVIATETPRALFALGEYAYVANPRLAALTWGAEDLSAELGAVARSPDGAFSFTFELARSMCLLAAGAAGIAAFDGVHVDLTDGTALEREAARACRDGFAGKLAIHPVQIEPINTAFSPRPADVARARAVIAAFAAKPDAGVLSLDGQMLDRPHLLQAQRILARAARHTLS